MPKKGSFDTTIGIIGFGVVGRALQHGFAQTTDFRIYDINPKISENSLEETGKDSDFIFICVPTPMKIESGECDVSLVDDTIKKLQPYTDNTDKIVIIKSTIPPGTTDGFIKKYKKSKIIFNPEFLTQRSYRLDFINTSRIILGGDCENTEEVKNLYRKRFPHTPIYQCNAKTAEMTKYVANCFFSVKVSFCNEIYDICKKMDINYDYIKEMTIADGRIGNSHMDVPGHDGLRGFGGLCFPKDLNGLIHKAEEIGVNPIIMKSVWEKNLEVRERKDWLNIEGAVL